MRVDLCRMERAPDAPETIALGQLGGWVLTRKDTEGFNPLGKTLFVVSCVCVPLSLLLMFVICNKRNAKRMPGSDSTKNIFWNTCVLHGLDTTKGPLKIWVRSIFPNPSALFSQARCGVGCRRITRSKMETLTNLATM